MEKVPAVLVELMAKAIHEIRRDLTAVQPEPSKIDKWAALPWDELPDIYQKVEVAVVAFRFSDPGADSRSSHQTWMNQLIKSGYKWGEKNSIVDKTHSFLVPYDQLPYEKRLGNAIIDSVMKNLGYPLVSVMKNPLNVSQKEEK